MAGWSVTADLEKFDEASTYFASRIPYTKADYDALDDKARAQAFWLSADLELDGVQTIFDELQHSIDNGTPFEEFKKRVGDKLGALAPKGYHIETVYRNWVQTSYNTGRWYQLQDADMIHLRPYLMFDAVLDSRTSAPCKSCDGTIKRHDDPFWNNHVPPLHHRCRSSLRSLRRGEAMRRGITEGTPDGSQPQDGFGVAPPLRGDLDHLEPQQSRFDPEVWEAFKARQAAMLDELEAANKQALADRLIRDQQDPQHWLETETRAKYGDEAGAAVAWGKAMEHRGLAMSPKDALKTHGKIVRVGVAKSKRAATSIEKVLKKQGVSSEDLESAHNTALLRDLATFAEAEGMAVEAADIRGVAALAGHAESIEPGEPIEFLDVVRLPGAALTEKQLESKTEKLAKFYGALSDATVKHPTGKIAVYSSARRRGGYSPAFRTIETGDGEFGTLVHEWGHALDHNDPKAAARALQFRERRTIGEPVVGLRELTGIETYELDEITKKDEFFDPYMGRQYDGDIADLTEVTTMAIQALVDIAEVGDLVDVDPYTLYFALGQLAGSKLP